jgi:hypothetical protein
MTALLLLEAHEQALRAAWEAYLADVPMHWGLVP